MKKVLKRVLALVLAVGAVSVAVMNAVPTFAKGKEATYTIIDDGSTGREEHKGGNGSGGSAPGATQIDLQP